MNECDRVQWLDCANIGVTFPSAKMPNVSKMVLWQDLYTKKTIMNGSFYVLEQQL